jgi:hypothetical protein
MSEINQALIRLTEDKVLTAVEESQTRLFGLYATINQQLNAINSLVVGAEALMDDEKAVAAFPPENAFRVEVNKMRNLLTSLNAMVESIPDTPRIGD